MIYCNCFSNKRVERSSNDLILKHSLTVPLRSNVSKGWMHKRATFCKATAQYGLPNEVGINCNEIYIFCRTLLLCVQIIQLRVLPPSIDTITCFGHGAFYDYTPRDEIRSSTIPPPYHELVGYIPFDFLERVSRLRRLPDCWDLGHVIRIEWMSIWRPHHT